MAQRIQQYENAKKGAQPLHVSNMMSMEQNMKKWDAFMTHTASLFVHNAP